MTISFGAEANVLTGGGRGKIAVDSSGNVIVVMLSDTAVIYSVGSIDLSTNTVSFPNSPITAYIWGADDNNPPINFDVGMSDSGAVALIWQTGGAGTGSNQLYYYTGQLEAGGLIGWHSTTPNNFDTGTYPSIAVAGNQAAEIHVSQNNTDKSYYHTGTLDGASIDGFNDGGTEFANYVDSCYYTSCVITTSDWFVASITGGQSYGTMAQSYSAGIGPELKLLDGPVYVAGATYTGVTLYNWGALLEVHDLDPTDLSFGTIYMTQGTVNENNDSNYGKLTWQPGTSTGVAGMYPDIAASGGGSTASYMVMVYTSTDDTSSTKARVVIQS
jgi:hypothetical protein